METFKTYYIQDEIVNGNRNVKEVASLYDGKDMDIIVNNNGKRVRKTLSKKEMMKLIGKKKSKTKSKHNTNTKTRDKKKLARRIRKKRSKKNKK